MKDNSKGKERKARHKHSICELRQCARESFKILRRNKTLCSKKIIALLKTDDRKTSTWIIFPNQRRVLFLLNLSD